MAKFYHFAFCVSFICLFLFIAAAIHILVSPNRLEAVAFINRPESTRSARSSRGQCFVETTTGPVSGQLISFDGQKVCQFLGIPYAEPPIGKRRFTKPVAASKRTQVIDASKLKASCMQTFPSWARHMMRPTTTVYSEDCLYLNIWQPVTDEASTSKSILFWLHGGGFQFGAGTLDETNGTALAAVEDVIVVTINYRLNAFGFLNLQSESVPGNMGLYDQAMALDWVSKNAKNFNGDHRQITLWGQGMGAISISGHLVSPITRNKFRRAIMQTGSIFSMRMMYGEYEKVAHDLISLVGCGGGVTRDHDQKSVEGQGEEEEEVADDTDEGDDDDEEGKSNKPRGGSESESSEDTNSLNEQVNLLSCLQEKPAKKILEAVDKMNDQNPISFMFSPFEHFFNNSSPSELKSDLTSFFSRTVKNVLFGFNSHEGSLLLNSLAPDKFTDKSDPVFNSTNYARQVLNEIFSTKLNVPKTILATGIDAALSGPTDGEENSLLKKMIDFTGNNIFICPTLVYADEVSAKNLIDAENIHLFHFAGRTEYNKLPKWFGTIHNEEVPIMFGYPLRYPDAFSCETINFSRKIMHTIGIFAKSG